MKKLALGIISLFVLMTSCSQDDLYESNSTENHKSGTAVNRYYGVKRSEQKVTKGVAQRSNLWSSNTVITVKFMNEPTVNDYPNNNVTDRIIRYAKEWEKYAGITFKYVRDGDATIRIGFNWNQDRYVTWSYIGTDAKIVTNQNEATASFADFELLSREEQRGEVLRLFGQILGLELEHRHLSFNAGWRDRVQSQWEGDIADIPWETLKKYVFDPLETTNAVMTDQYDPQSIMIWPFPRTVATNTERDFNLELSETDKAFIANLYPKVEDGCIFEGIVSEKSNMYNTYYYKAGFKIVYHSQDTPLIIQWDDESKENIGMDFDGFVTYNGTVPRGKLSSIRIYGDAAGVTEFHSNYIDMNGDYTTSRGVPFTGDYNFSRFTNLKRLGFTCIGSEKINLLNNTNLEELTLVSEGEDKLNCDLTRLTQLKKLNLRGISKTDFSANTVLVELNLISFTSPGKSDCSFDFSKNKNLETISMLDQNSTTKILKFDISKNVKLKKLDLTIYYGFDQIDLSQNIGLKNLHLQAFDLIQLDVSAIPNLESLSCYAAINKLALSKNKEQKLKSIGLMGVNLTELDLSNCTYLEELYLSYCQYLKQVDVSNNKFLKAFGTSPHDNIEIIGWNKPTTKSIPALSAEKRSMLEDYATKRKLNKAN